MNIVAASVVMALGGVTAVWAVTSLGWARFIGRHSTTPQLSFRGPYQRVRHPFYLGVLLMVIGLVVLAPSLRSAAVLCAALALIAVSIAAEERRLQARCGEAYRRYRARVPALLPVKLLKH